MIVRLGIKCTTIFISIIILITFFMWGAHYVRSYSLQNSAITASSNTSTHTSQTNTATSANNLLISHQEAPKLPNYTHSFTLQFTAQRTKLTSVEQTNLLETIQSLKIKNQHQVHIYSGKIPAENNVLFSQKPKLRLQSVARVIYPYTQNITMRSHPSLDAGKIVVDFIEKPVVY